MPFADHFFVVISWIGSIWVLLPLALACASIGWPREDVRFAPLFAVVAASLSSHLLKVLVDRERPQLHEMLIALPQEASFPSSHAAQIAAMATVLIMLVPAGYRLAAAVVLTLLAAAVGISRLYLQVHWPSDVIGGWLLGILAALIVLYCVQWRAA